MRHKYELRRLNKDNSKTTVMEIFGEPKDVKKRIKEYTEEFPGIYSLYQIRKVVTYFTEKYND